MARTRQPRLDRYFRRGLITDAQWTAGDRLRSDMVTAARPCPGNPVGPTWERAAAAQRQVRAMISLPGKLDSLLTYTVYLGLAPSEWARRNGLPAGDGLALLRFGLTLLEKHYDDVAAAAARGRADVAAANRAWEAAHPC
jgi:hypothetical protein